MNKEVIAKSKAQIKNKWFETKEDELDMALNIIDVLERQCKKQQEVIDKLELENKVLKEQMVAMVKPNYTYGIR